MRKLAVLLVALVGCSAGHRSATPKLYRFPAYQSGADTRMTFVDGYGHHTYIHSFPMKGAF